MGNKVTLNESNLSSANWLVPGTKALPCLTVEQIRSVEQQAFELIDSWLIMRAAGFRATEKILELANNTNLPDKKPNFVVLAGPGNNGGDALVVASQLAKKGHKVKLCECLLGKSATKNQPGSSDRQKAKQLSIAAGLDHTPIQDIEWAENTVVIDGLLGIGCTRPPEGKIAEAIRKISALQSFLNKNDQRHQLTVIALDCPSGLDCNTGLCPGIAIEANYSLCFIALKPGLLCNQGKDMAGDIFIDTLGCDPLLATSNASTVVGHQAYQTRLPFRKHNNHKANFGSLAIYGGDKGMIGACLLSARTALMLGTGRVAMTLLSEHNREFIAPKDRRPETEMPFIDTLFPEIMNKSLVENQLFSDCAVIGPGLGTSTTACDLLQQVLFSERGQPLVIDADAINMLAIYEHVKDRLIDIRKDHSEPNHELVITPHAQEAARLLSCSTKQINANRMESALKISSRFNCTVVLKGAGTLIADANHCLVNSTGGPALATAGSGDVLAGAIGAFLAQGLNGKDAASCAVWLHGLSVQRNSYHEQPLLVSHASEIALRMKQLYNHLLCDRTLNHR